MSDKRHNNPGRPKKYTDEAIELHARNMLAWAHRLGEKPFFLKTYAIDNKFPAEELSRWAESNEIFSQALKMTKDIQERNLVQAMWGAKNPGGFIFTLKNVSGWRDKTELSGDKDNPVHVHFDKVDKELL